MRLRHLLPIFFLLASLVPSEAHRIDSTSITADFRSDGTYTVTLSVEPARIPVDKSDPVPPLPPESKAPEDPAERQAIFDLAEPFFRSSFTFFFDESELDPQFTFEFIEVAEKDAVAEGVAFRDGKTHLFLVGTFTGKIPADAQNFLFKLSTELSMAVVFVGSIDGEHKGRTQALFAGEQSRPYPLASVQVPKESPGGESEAPEFVEDDTPQRSFLETAYRYIKVGFEHILPDGLDHILFVVGLFLLSQKIGPLLWQVTAFTLAHTITLALAYLDIVSVPAHIVEPLIALSIAVVAIENIFTQRFRPHRVAVVFGFGLLHGLGFAGAFADLQLPKEEFIEGLIFLNIGVEIGQLAVIAIALITFLPFYKSPTTYRHYVAIPVSIYIAAVGIVATIERIWPDSIPSALSFLQIL